MGVGWVGFECDMTDVAAEFEGDLLGKTIRLFEI